MISIVIPTIDAADSLQRCLPPLQEGQEAGLVREVIITDGGSSDQTRIVAKDAGCQVMSAPKGRGGQLAAGVTSAQSEWLLILHADTVLGGGWFEEMRHFVESGGAERKVAVFRFALDDPHPAARRIEWLVALRMKLFALPYGDQGLLVHRSLYNAVGGFTNIPLMEDVDLIRRLKRRIGRDGIVQFKTPAVTSAARYRSGGFVMRPLRNLLCLALYFLGLPPPILTRLYG